ncbi:hypothetical protein BVRB_4g097320 [Beta vulgaris subsp. vulgaris]|uniref:Uncharacterized protein n=1 Tax=Beta vulgaris subsp. vulgaris TaxID=3555 RepID=A0A0J8BCY6_BETVV|nr:hypothetical protein BVRB_4g097320 [Beta vulgaris subsp. vulgaris]
MLAIKRRLLTWIDFLMHLLNKTLSFRLIEENSDSQLK